MKSRLAILALAVICVCACQSKVAPAPADAEYGPYTVQTIIDGVYHIQDYNTSNPAGEEFDAEGNKTHFNNCSDIYLLVGSKEALIIDLSNYVRWADDAEESLRKIVYERTQGKPLTITFTHNHGDHTGMLPAFVQEPGIKFALPRTDFARLRSNYPEEGTEMIGEGHIFDLGGLVVESILVPGHTAGSMVFYLKDKDILFTGDAIGSGHGVWIFDFDGFHNYFFAVPHLVAYVNDPANGVNKDNLQIYGGHYWQKDWLTLPEGREMGMEYLDQMEELVNQIVRGQAACEPSNLGRANLDTYFRNGNAIIAWNTADADRYAKRYAEPIVYHGQDIVFRQIDNHTWEGNGFRGYNESVYIVEGNDKALVIDAGTNIKDLDKIVAGITSKPQMLVLTHVHGDHVGAAGCYPEVYLNAGDMVNVPSNMANYEGEIKYLSDGQVIDLGGREIEVIFTPGHTPGSTTFFDKAAGYGFSGDSFGSTDLLVFTNLSTQLATLRRIEPYMIKNGIKMMYPGHYSGDNPETLQRVRDEIKMIQEVLDGKRKGEVSNRSGLNAIISDYGVRIEYRDPDGIK